MRLLDVYLNQSLSVLRPSGQQDAFQFTVNPVAGDQNAAGYTGGCVDLALNTNGQLEGRDASFQIGENVITQLRN